MTAAMKKMALPPEVGEPRHNPPGAHLQVVVSRWRFRYVPAAVLVLGFSLLASVRVQALSQSLNLERAGFVSAGGYAEAPKFKLVDQAGLDHLGLMHNSEYHIGPGTAIKSLPAEAFPGDLALEQNYPNPFNSSTTFRYSVPRSALITIKVYSALGQLVTTLFSGQQAPGFYQLAYHGCDQQDIPLPSGIYFCRLSVTGESRIIKFAILR